MIELLVVIGLIAVGMSGMTLWLLSRKDKSPEVTNAIEKFNIQMTERTRAIQDGQATLQTTLTEHLMKSFDHLRGQLVETLTTHAKQTDKQISALTQQTNTQLKEISGQVEKRLTEGFEKTNATFHDVIKRLALIDEAQKKITELSGNVVSLQEILADKRSRGAFGEVQLNALVRNVMPEQHISFQHTLSTGARVDCMLFLPEPTGNIAIDAKFPLESYQRMVSLNIAESDRSIAARQFKQDIKRHIQDIESKYIIKGETSDGALMFIPAEAIFAEIHAHHPELVEEAQRRKVWITSPTTLMAILTTARAVIKDDATRKQVHIIQEHLGKLSKDFGLFQERMDKLSTHIKQVHSDVENINISAKKITTSFGKIERVELEHSEQAKIELLEE